MKLECLTSLLSKVKVQYVETYRIMPKMARGDRFDTRISLVPGIPALRMTDTIHRVLD